MSVLNKETMTRILSAIVTLPVLIYVLITEDFFSLPVFFASCVISLTCLYEYYMITYKSEEEKPFIKTGLLAGFFVNVVMFLYAFGKPFGYSGIIAGFDARLFIMFTVLFMAVVLTLQLFTRPLKGGAYSMAVTVFGVMYISLSVSHLILLKSLRDGSKYILLLTAVVMLNDTGAYFGGIMFGKHKAKIAASPNKSWEGYFSGLLFSVIAFILGNQVIASFIIKGPALFTMLESAILGIIVSVLATIGDLVESAVKRDGGIKDSGRIIPGHGGMWDVFDAIIFALPFFYYYLVFKGIP
ncbi:MAG TPA: phosphatidate cytidylyltransferase [Spirochaetota bacterium]|nr:phosphatidate cytidylyltransferase [Spirochaetota bacterium]